MRIFGRFIQTKEETKLFIIAKKKHQSVQFQKKIQMFGYSSVGSLKDDSFAVETLCRNRPWNEGKFNIFFFFDFFQNNLFAA